MHHVHAHACYIQVLHAVPFIFQGMAPQDQQQVFNSSDPAFAPACCIQVVHAVLRIYVKTTQ